MSKIVREELKRLSREDIVDNYVVLDQELDRLEKLEIRLDSLLRNKNKIIEKLKESNEFYAEVHNWIKQQQVRFTIISRVDHELNGNTGIGGKKARQVKKEVELLEKNP